MTSKRRLVLVVSIAALFVAVGVLAWQYLSSGRPDEDAFTPFPRGSRIVHKDVREIPSNMDSWELRYFLVSQDDPTSEHLQDRYLRSLQGRGWTLTSEGTAVDYEGNGGCITIYLGADEVPKGEPILVALFERYSGRAAMFVRASKC